MLIDVALSDIIKEWFKSEKWNKILYIESLSINDGTYTIRDECGFMAWIYENHINMIISESGHSKFIKLFPTDPEFFSKLRKYINEFN